MTFDKILDDGRLWAVRYDGAIKLTATMSERSHTLAELAKLEQVRNNLIDNGVFDIDSLNDYINNEQSC